MSTAHEQHGPPVGFPRPGHERAGGQQTSARFAHGPSSGSEGTVQQPFPSGTGRDSLDTPPFTQQSDSFHPFPLGEGTGERVESAIAPGVQASVPDRGNAVGTGTDGGTTKPFTIFPHPTLSPNRASGASVLMSAGSPQAGASWLPASLSELVQGLQDGTLAPPQPTVGRLTDGSFWLYAGATNGLAGESGCGKTWTALAAVKSELEDGNNVIYIDMENGPLGLVSRLLNLGVPADVIGSESRFAYVRPDEAFRDDVRSVFWMLLEFMKPTLVVLDSTGESMALEGTDPNSDDAVAVWFQRVATAIAMRGPAVLLLDHLPKSDSGAASPIGSQRKRAAISGAQFIQQVGKDMAFSKGRPGQARIMATKDRHGYFVTGESSITLTVTPDTSRGPSGVEAALGPDVNDEWAPTRHMLGVSEFLKGAQDPQTTDAIKKGTKGKTETVVRAIQVLIASGYVTTSPGPRKSTLHELVKTYSLGDPYTVPDGISEDSLQSGGCDQSWHDGRCKPDWCHHGHHGKCNELAEQGYVLDEDGEVLSEPGEVVAQREEAVRLLFGPGSASAEMTDTSQADQHPLTNPSDRSNNS